MDSAVRLPGVTNAWTMPIKARIDMLATGIRTPVGVKLYGPDLAELERLGREVEAAVQLVPGTRSVFAERAVSGYYVDIDIDRMAIARYGLSMADVQDVIATAIGGMTITQTVEGRERYGVRIRYPQELRDSPERLANVLIPVNRAIGMSTSTSAPVTGEWHQPVAWLWTRAPAVWHRYRWARWRQFVPCPVPWSCAPKTRCQPRGCMSTSPVAISAVTSRRLGNA
jgi:multidrug efflux pump subunit AcrB